MREGWEQVALGELTTKRVDFTPVVASTEYSVVGVQRSGWGLLARDAVRGDSMKFSKLMRLDANDLVYRVITAFEAPSAVVDASFDGSYVTPQTFPVFRIDASRLLPGFMRLLTTSPVFHEAMSERCTGTVLRRKTISVGAFQSIPIDLPSLAEQQRIVDLIGSLDEAIEAAEEFTETAAHAYGALASTSVTASSRVLPISELVTTAKAGGTPPRAQTKYFDGGIPWLKSGEVVGRDIVTASESVSEAALAASSAWVVPAGAVVIAMYGATAAQVGRLGKEMATNQAVLALIADETVISGGLLYHLLRGQTVALKSKAIGAAQPNLSKGVVLVHEVAIPKHEDQLLIEDLLDSALGQAEESANFATSLRTLRTNLLTALLSGAHEIPASYDDLLSEAV